MKKSIQNILSTILPLLSLCGCSKTVSGSCPEDMAEVHVRLECSGVNTKAADPDENMLHDLNIFVFDKDGNMEEDIFMTPGKTISGGSEIPFSFRWLKGTECQVFVCANFGFRLEGIQTRQDLLGYRYHIAYPDEYSRGIPMSGKSGMTMVGGEHGEIQIKLERMMAKISLSVDRRALDKNVSFNVRSVRIGGCPKSADVFKASKAEGSNDVFNTGFMKSYGEADALNIDERPGISREINLYMLENMQGTLLPDAKSEKDKVLDTSDALSSVCSYVEIKAEYASDSLSTGPDSYLVYRFYLGDGPTDFSVERNFLYRISVRPKGSGLDGTGWRMDKTELTGYGTATITVHPGKYIEGKVGEDIHIRADVKPEGSRFTLGTEELEYDKSRGLYDYTADSDGHGVVLHLKQAGSGIVYMEAGAPVSASEMVFITINN